MKAKVHPQMTLEELAGFVCQRLKDSGIDAFLSGGGVVSIYVDNPYVSLDLDFVSVASSKEIEKAMRAMGFDNKQSRHFFHPDHAASVEFPGYAAMIGDQPIIEFAERKTAYGKLKLLTPTDSIKDRLAAFFHWNDPQGLEQAILIARQYPIKWFDLEKFAKVEGQTAKYQEFLKGAKARKA